MPPNWIPWVTMWLASVVEADDPQSESRGKRVVQIDRPTALGRPTVADDFCGASTTVPEPPIRDNDDPGEVLEGTSQMPVERLRPPRDNQKHVAGRQGRRRRLPPRPSAQGATGADAVCNRRI